MNPSALIDLPSPRTTQELAHFLAPLSSRNLLPRSTTTSRASSRSPNKYKTASRSGSPELTGAREAVVIRDTLSSENLLDIDGSSAVAGGSTAHRRKRRRVTQDRVEENDIEEEIELFHPPRSSSRQFYTVGSRERQPAGLVVLEDTPERSISIQYTSNEPSHSPVKFEVTNADHNECNTNRSGNSANGFASRVADTSIKLESPSDHPIASSSKITTTTRLGGSSGTGPTSTSAPRVEPLSAYTCPICFSPPTNATLTPCGHICCGPCLFTAVKTTMQRSMHIAMERPVPRCPVCRAQIPNWDGRGSGVVGLKLQVIYTL